MTPDNWLPQPEQVTLSHTDVHVWRATLDLSYQQQRALEQILSADEQARAARFHFPLLQSRCRASRGILRVLLGRYLHIAPNVLAFSYTRLGKPFLQTGAGYEAITFNVSHSGGIALYAVSNARSVGIDLEQICYDLDVTQLAAHFFSVQEQNELSALPVSQQVPAFFNGWTRKEAYLKARGVGLSLPLNQFSVPLHSYGAIHTTGLHQGDDDARWTLRAIQPGFNLAAALAVEGPLDWIMTCWQWKDEGL
jgi:4'-phosphopantetheinyl transferase